MSDLAASVATSQNTRLNSQLSCSTSANLNTINNQGKTINFNDKLYHENNIKLFIILYN